MVQGNVFTSESDGSGESRERLMASFRVDGQELRIEGDARFVQVGMPVYSARYGRLIDFDTDGEEWARNLPGAYRNGLTHVEVIDVGAAEGALVHAGAGDYAQARRAG